MCWCCGHAVGLSERKERRGEPAIRDVKPWADFVYASFHRQVVNRKLGPVDFCPPFITLLIVKKVISLCSNLPLKGTPDSVRGPGFVRKFRPEKILVENFTENENELRIFQVIFR